MKIHYLKKIKNYISNKELDIEQLLSKSLERQLGNSDRGSGLFLSGGVDSSLLVSLALKNNIISSNSSIYTSRSLDPTIDESNRVKKFLKFVDNEKKNKISRVILRS